MALCEENMVKSVYLSYFAIVMEGLCPFLMAGKEENTQKISLDRFKAYKTTKVSALVIIPFAIIILLRKLKSWIMLSDVIQKLG